MDREKLEEEWGSLKKEKAKIEQRLTALDLAFRSEEDELADAFLREDAIMINQAPKDVEGAVATLLTKENAYVLGGKEKWQWMLFILKKMTLDEFNKAIETK